jgi:hypothetical protein
MKEGRERENLAVFCGLGGLVKEMRGEVRCRVDVEERRGPDRHALNKGGGFRWPIRHAADGGGQCRVSDGRGLTEWLTGGPESQCRRFKSNQLSQIH